jgi:hypothetical protein
MREERNVANPVHHPDMELVAGDSWAIVCNLLDTTLAAAFASGNALPSLLVDLDISGRHSRIIDLLA